MTMTSRGTEGSSAAEPTRRHVIAEHFSGNSASDREGQMLCCVRQVKNWTAKSRINQSINQQTGAALQPKQPQQQLLFAAASLPVQLLYLCSCSICTATLPVQLVQQAHLRI